MAVPAIRSLLPKNWTNREGGKETKVVAEWSTSLTRSGKSGAANRHHPAHAHKSRRHRQSRSPSLNKRRVRFADELVHSQEVQELAADEEDDFDVNADISVAGVKKAPAHQTHITQVLSDAFMVPITESANEEVDTSSISDSTTPMIDSCSGNSNSTTGSRRSWGSSTTCSSHGGNTEQRVAGEHPGSKKWILMSC